MDMNFRKEFHEDLCALIEIERRKKSFFQKYDTVPELNRILSNLDHYFTDREDGSSPYKEMQDDEMTLFLVGLLELVPLKILSNISFLSTTKYSGLFSDEPNKTFYSWKFQAKLFFDYFLKNSKFDLSNLIFDRNKSFLKINLIRKCSTLVCDREFIRQKIFLGFFKKKYFPYINSEFIFNDVEGFFIDKNKLHTVTYLECEYFDNQLVLKFLEGTRVYIKFQSKDWRFLMKHEPILER